MKSFSVRLGNLLYNKAFPLYKPLYFTYKFRKDKQEISLLRQKVKPGTTILDIGANIGFYTTLFSRLTGPGGRVVSIEPDITNFSYLAMQAGSLDNVELVHGAAGPVTGTTNIYLSDMLNVDHRTYEPEAYTSTQQVKMYRPDDLIGQGQPVDFVKMDIQGFEVQALQGMQQILQVNDDIHLLSEYWPYGLKMAGNSGSELVEFLTKLGFHIRILIKDRWIPFNSTEGSISDSTPQNLYYNIYASRNAQADITHS